MTNYEEARVKLTKTQLKQLKSAVKNKTGTTLKPQRQIWNILQFCKFTGSLVHKENFGLI